MEIIINTLLIFSFLAICATIDHKLTIKAVRIGAREQNSFMKWLMAKNMKLSIIIPFLVLLLLSWELADDLWAIPIPFAIYGAVLISNVIHYRKLKRARDNALVLYQGDNQ